MKAQQLPAVKNHDEGKINWERGRKGEAEI
jgi:hypothetical protein